MLIRVNYVNGRFDYVNGAALDDLIDSKRIVKFQRSSGWVTIGKDPVRSRSRHTNTQSVSREVSFLKGMAKLR